VSILAQGAGAISGQEYLPAVPGQLLWGRLPCAADPPVLTVAPGTTVTIDTVSHEGILEDQGRDPVAFFGRHGVPADAVLAEAAELAASGYRRDPATDGPHVVTGPVAVTGAQPGDLLAVTVLETARRVPYGVISSRHGRGALPGELPAGAGPYCAFASVREEADGTAYGVLPLTGGGPPTVSPSTVSPRTVSPRTVSPRTVSFPLRPFLGIMGVAVPGSVRPHSVPPGRHGGNIDIRLLTVGSTLYLPVQVPGALAYVGDPHFAQGDGEVALTALEASLRATLRFDVIPAAAAAASFGELAGPVAETAEYLVPTGLDESLDVAMMNCVRAALGLLQVRYGMDQGQAYAYLSAATDFDISQVVDLVKGVHARIRKADFG
jgi:acetamidase/formamidase